ncbi:type I glyceraldehyde-3-phosphate dehydrogenase [Candidatus Methylopumilus rimovensis]|jgi:glyceraldehyde 3-phosphate dehydrogenase|uniref:type I glyceraldehyde-3-phosphate dehydrogenase n=1 Tax=Candidatus Methylopumilus rimovensis TaxID=2588535 RepID=UPI00112271A2|nr:type I glyceraldehyde-3-phosphate dehydrogenase [Candidatus Methylopumilus rimovensis]QDD11825.1 type I glyceraldehyde-3-phosphate dehydrogenase [Candidatus Methylopumilus rimovensis]
MAIKIAITGFGRIGRLILRAIYELNHQDIKVVAINSSRGDATSNAHLLKYDSAHGKFNADIKTNDHEMIINGDVIKFFSTRNPEELPWDKLNVDVVMECTGAFTSKEKSIVHLKQGAKKVLISAPGGKDVDATIVYGVNHQILKATDTVVSNASCTTNGLAPMVKPLHDQLGIVTGLMTTIHSYTNDQYLNDNQHKDPRRARSATTSMIPTKTGAADAVGLVIPELKGKLDGIAIRVPTLNVSLVELTFTPKKATSKDEVNRIIKEAANQGSLKGILIYNDEPLVSVDFNHTEASSFFDGNLTKVSEDGLLVKVFGWYDNEWAFSCRMIDTAIAMMSAK